MKAATHRRFGRVAGNSRVGVRYMADYFYLGVLLISFPGYPLIAAGANLIGFENSTVSLIMRSLNVIFAIFLILFYFNSHRDRTEKLVLSLFLIFWSAYLFRIFIDTLLVPVPLGQDLSFYWIWAIGGSFLPMLGLALKPYGPKQADQYFQWFYLITLLAGILAALSASGSMESETYGIQDTGRLRVGNTLNPITLGHLGAMLMIQSIWAIIFFRSWFRQFRKLVFFFGFALGFYLLVAANSRGPIVAAFACMVIIFLFVSTRYKSIILLFALLSGGIFVPLARYLEESHNISSFSRLFGNSLAQHAEQSMRPQLFNRALDIFVQNPWFGGAMEDTISSSYPHNIILESLMAVGIFFSIILIISFIVLLSRSFFILNKLPHQGWICLLFIQYLIGSQFSGSIYTSTFLWASVGLLISFSIRNEFPGNLPNYQKTYR